MSHFEGIFVPDPEPVTLKPADDMTRLKLGEIFNNSRDEYEFVCIHCSQKFTNFNQFTQHAQDHLTSRLQHLVHVKEEHSIPQELNHNDAIDEFLAQSVTQDDDKNLAFDDDVVDYFDKNSDANAIDEFNDEKNFIPSKSNPDELAQMNGLINSYCSVDRTTKDRMNPDEYRPLVAGVDYEKHDGKFTCLRCHKTVTKSSTLRHHLASHRKTKYYKCPLCEKSFIAIENIHKHISRVHKTVYSRAVIREAQGLTRSQFQAYLAQYQAQQNVKKEFECYMCRKSLSTLARVKQHLVSHDQKKTAKPHRIEIMRDNKKYRKCLQCDKFYTINYIREHMLTHNKDNKRFVCELCGMAFLVASQLRKHMVRHERERCFKCDICPATYTRSTALIKHRRTHPEPLPFVCNVCGKDYFSSRTLQSHMGKHEIKKIN